MNFLIHKEEQGGSVVLMGKTRTLIGKFIKNKWTSMNMRCGKYRHLGNKHKNKCYENISIEFSRLEFKNWCLKREQQILLFTKPSIDRIDSTKNYTLDNIQVVELSQNVRRKRLANRYINGPKSSVLRGVSKYGNSFRSRITINKKETFLGSFKNIEDAYETFRIAYYKHYGKNPW